MTVMTTEPSVELNSPEAEPCIKARCAPLASVVDPPVPEPNMIAASVVLSETNAVRVPPLP